MQVKEVLENAYGIRAEYILDNNLCRYNSDIKAFEFLDNVSCDKYCVILASTNPDIYGGEKRTAKVFCRREYSRAFFYGEFWEKQSSE